MVFTNGSFHSPFVHKKLFFGVHSN